MRFDLQDLQELQRFLIGQSGSLIANLVFCCIFANHVSVNIISPLPRPTAPGVVVFAVGDGSAVLLVEVFPLFPLFPVFFDSAGGRIERKNLFVKVRPFEKRNMRV